MTACTTGTHNIGNAARMIAYGDAEAMVADGAEKASTPLGMAGFGVTSFSFQTRKQDLQNHEQFPDVRKTPKSSYW